MSENRFIAALAVPILFAAVSCGDANTSNDGSDSRLTAYSEQQFDIYEHVQQLSGALLSKKGAVNRGLALSGVDMSNKKSLRAYAADADDFVDAIDKEVIPAMAGVFLKVIDNENRRLEFIQAAMNGFTQNPPAAPRMPKPRFLVAAIGVTAVALTVYSAFSQIANAQEDCYKIVPDMAAKNDTARKNVIRILNENGAQLPETASTDEISEQFNLKMGRADRRRAVNAVRAWSAGAVMDNAIPENDAAAIHDRLVEDKEILVNSANKLGKVAIESVVSGSTAATGGVGDALNGLGVNKPAASVIDLTLQITETDPIALTQKNAIVTVQTASDTEGTTVDDMLRPPVAMTTPDKARARIEAIASRSTSADRLTQEEVGEAIFTMLAPLEEAKPDTSGIGYPRMNTTFNKVELPSKISGDSPAVKEMSFFSAAPDTQTAFVTVTGSGFVPVEVSANVVNRKITADIHLVPLDGTITVKAAPGESSDDAQEFTISAHLEHIYDETVTAFIDATQAVVSGNRAATVPLSGDVSWTIASIGNSNITVRRSDSGESKTIMVKGKGGTTSDPSGDPDDVQPSGKCKNATLTGSYEDDVEGAWGFEGKRLYRGHMKFTAQNGAFTLSYQRKEICDIEGFDTRNCQISENSLELTGSAAPVEIEWKDGDTTCDFTFKFDKKNASDIEAFLDLPQYFAPLIHGSFVPKQSEWNGEAFTMSYLNELCMMLAGSLGACFK